MTLKTWKTPENVRRIKPFTDQEELMSHIREIAKRLDESTYTQLRGWILSTKLAF